MKMMIAALINRFGDSIDAIASAWIVYEITNNAAWSALIFGINKVPSILITPLAGEVLGGGAEILSLLGKTVMLGMLLGSLTYHMLAKIVSGKKILIIGNLGMSLFYISLPAFSALYTNKIFMYIFSSVLGGILGYTAALTSSYMNVFSIKRIKEEYLDRTSSISTAVSIATVPIVSFILSGLVSYVSTAHIFIYTGVLALLVTICMLFSKTLAGNGEKSVSDNVDELQSTEAV